MRTRRTGFTLVELLVVITVIAILAAISLQVVGVLIGQARESATRATMAKVQALLNSRAQALDRLMARRGFLTGSEAWIEAGKIATSVNCQKTIARKMVARKWFPQASAELADPLGTWRTHDLYPDLVDATGTPIPGFSPAEVFFVAITTTTAGDSPVAADAFSAAEVADADGSGHPEFVDSWGHSLRFYRWPTRLFRPTGTGGPIDVATAQALFSTLPVFTGNLQNDLARDPDDGLNECAAIPGFEASFSTPATYHVLLIVSAGPDGVLGLFEPDDVPNFGHLGAVRDRQALADDLVSMNLRAGGK